MASQTQDFADRILHAVNNRDRKAYHMLFQEYYASLVQFAMNYLDHPADAEDIVQDLFVSIWEKSVTFSSMESLRVYLYRSVRNNSLRIRKHQMVKDRYADSLSGQTDLDEGTDLKILEEEMYRKLFAGIDALPPRCREVFLLSMEGKSIDEIADRMEISQNTVKTQKKKALQILRKTLGAYVFWYFFPGPGF